MNNFSENFEYILYAFIALVVFGPVLLRKMGNKKENAQLTPFTIVSNSVLGNKIFSIPFVIAVTILLLVVFYQVSLEKGTPVWIKIFAIVIIFTILITSIILPVIQLMRVWKGDYEIVKDTLTDKKKTALGIRSNGKNTNYALCFENYYRKYNKTVGVTYREYIHAQPGDSYYLLFFKGFSDPFVFDVNHYQLTEEQYLKDYSEL